MKRLLCGCALWVALCLAAPGLAQAAPLDLDAAVQQAMTQSPDVLRRQAEVAAASDRIDAAGQFANPQLRLGVDVPDGDPSDARVEGALRFRFDHPATRMAAKAEARRDRAELRGDLSEARRTVDLEIRLLYVDHAFLSSSLAVERERLVLLQRGVTVLEEAVALGRATTIDARRARIKVTRTQAAVRRMQREQRHLEAKIRDSVGADPTATIRSQLARPGTVPSDVELVRHALASDPTLLSQASALEESNALVRSAKAQAIPWVDFLQVGRTFPSRIRPGGYEFVAGVTLPLFSLNRRGIKAAKSERAARVRAVETRRLGVERDVLRWAAHARQAAADARVLDEAARENHTVAPIADPLTANALALDALELREELLLAQREYALAAARLSNAAGLQR